MKDRNDAPVWYTAEEASAWAAGYNHALANRHAVEREWDNEMLDKSRFKSGDKVEHNGMAATVVAVAVSNGVVNYSLVYDDGGVKLGLLGRVISRMPQ